MQEEIIDNLLCLYESFSIEYELEHDALPYHFNIVDELHVNENAHTRILMKLLQYNKGKQFPILNLFLKLFTETTGETIEIQKPQLFTGKDFIDGLIKDFGKYAIIIENKIYGAPDQENQIERYINTLEKEGYKNENIYVVYLTIDGTKVVRDYSFTAKAKRKLGFKSDIEAGRYVQINYEQHILPWLKEIAPIYIHEEYLYSGVFQYVDFIEGILEIRKEDKPMKEKLNKYLEEKLELIDNNSSEKYQIITEKVKLAEEFVEYMHELQVSYITEICAKHLLPNIKRFSLKNGFEIDSYTFEKDRIEIILLNPLWKKSKLIFHSEGNDNLLGLFYFDKDKPFAAKTKEYFSKDYKTSHWFPAWKYATNGYRNMNDDFWLKVSDGGLSRYIIDEFKKIIKIVEENDLKV